MYEAFYGFKEKPFHLNPDPRFFFGSTGHKRVLAYLNYGVRQGEGFIVVTGEVGTGKTTLIYTLLEELARHKDVIVAHLVSPPTDGNDLLPMVASAFGLSEEGSSRATLLRRIEQFLIDRAREEKRALLIVDEAQGLSMEALEVLRMLTNFQLNHKALLQGFLIGQAEFRGTLRSEQLEQLRQRVIASCHLGPMELDETRQYIEHRLGVVGWKGDPAFTAGAHVSIHDFAGGIPRRINNICDRIMLVGYLEETHTITRELVNTVIQELTNESLGSGKRDDEEAPPITRPPKQEKKEAVVADKLFSNFDLQGRSTDQRLFELEERLAVVEDVIAKARATISAIMSSGTAREKRREPADWEG
jgi:putative secretion ATPase (PEP-CTERM system associated)